MADRPAARPVARPAARPFDPALLLRTLAEHDVRYVLIGALAARLSGFPRVTADADLTPASDPGNVAKLASAFRALEARVWTAGIPEGLAFDCSATTLARAEGWSLVTAAGRVDVLFHPADVADYDGLAQEAERFDAYGVTLLAAPLTAILRMKEAADRPQDRQDAAVIRAMLARDAEGGRSG